MTPEIIAAYATAAVSIIGAITALVVAVMANKTANAANTRIGVHMNSTSPQHARKV